ncbi:hypothetical protein ABIF66_002930 [Bradyrhizobium japonicum]
MADATVPEGFYRVRLVAELAERGLKVDYRTVWESSNSNEAQIARALAEDLSEKADSKA